MKRILAICLASAMLVGCSDTPDSILKKEYAEYDDTQSKPLYIPISELSYLNEEFDSLIKGQSYDNLTLSENFNLYTAKDAAIYDVVFMDDFDKNAEMLFKHYISEAPFDVSKMEYHDDPAQASSWLYKTDDMLSMATSIGGFVLSDIECLNIHYGTGLDYISTFSFDDHELGEKVYIGDKEVSLDELKQSVDDCIGEFTELADYPNEIKPFTITTQKIEDGSVAAHIHCRSYYKGVAIFDIMSLNNEYSFEITDLIGPICTVAEGNEIGQFACTAAYVDYKTEQELTEIISPAWAMNAVSEKLSGYLGYEVQREELVYMPECIGNTDGIEANNGLNKGDIIRLTPYWVIYFDFSWWHETFAAVNAVTGDIDFINNAK